MGSLLTLIVLGRINEEHQTSLHFCTYSDRNPCPMSIGLEVKIGII
jgi:hypothetical protein